MQISGFSPSNWTRHASAPTHEVGESLLIGFEKSIGNPAEMRSVRLPLHSVNLSRTPPGKLVLSALRADVTSGVYGTVRGVGRIPRKTRERISLVGRFVVPLPRNVKRTKPCSKLSTARRPRLHPAEALMHYELVLPSPLEYLRWRRGGDPAEVNCHRRQQTVRRSNKPRRFTHCRIQPLNILRARRSRASASLHVLREVRGT